MLAVPLLALLGASPWTCPPDVCAPVPAAPVEPVAHKYGRQLRRVMRAFPKLRGRAPWFSTSEGARLRTSDSIRTLNARLAEADGALYVGYGHCASHSRTCPSASLEITFEPEDLDDGIHAAHTVTRLPSQRVYQLSNETAFEQEWLVHIPAKDGPARTAAVWIIGTLGFDRLALGALPVRAIQRALSQI